VKFEPVDGKEVEIETFAVGGKHMFASTKNRDVTYCWGSGQKGQLGLGDTDNRLSPTVLSFFQKNQLTLASIRCGEQHSVFLAGTQQFLWN
jgi:alpha-tubulin suppressor-like RCC1 family protein